LEKFGEIVEQRPIAIDETLAAQVNAKLDEILETFNSIRGQRTEILTRTTKATEGADV
jgi:hypothetical protein